MSSQKGRNPRLLSTSPFEEASPEASFTRTLLGLTRGELVPRPYPKVQTQFIRLNGPHWQESPQISEALGSLERQVHSLEAVESRLKFLIREIRDLTGKDDT